MIYEYVELLTDLASSNSINNTILKLLLNNPSVTFEECVKHSIISKCKSCAANNKCMIQAIANMPILYTPSECISIINIMGLNILTIFNPIDIN